MTSSRTPTPKVQAQGIAAMAALVLVWTLAQFGIQIPQDVALAAVTLVILGTGYIKRDDTPVVPPGPGKRRRESGNV